MASSNKDLLKHFGDVELWSPSLTTTSSPAAILSDKIVLLYFSAQWCGPCGRFTPVLKDLYASLKNDAKVEFEVVFCSLDKVKEGYDNYTSTMPWWCLPFESKCMGKLANLYVGGRLSIPLLVVLDKDGTVIVPDGVGEVAMDPQGANFPWRPKAVVDLLPPHYIGNDRQMHSMSNLDDKYLMLYFSAHWCPPCKAFTPKLSKAYTALKESRSDFELLFVSSDRDKESFDEYFGEMTFGALPFDARDAKADLSKRLQVKGIPSLMIFGPRPSNGGDRPLVNNAVRGTIEGGDFLSEFPFEPKMFGDLNTTTENINSVRCIVVFFEGGDDEEQEQTKTHLESACERFKIDHPEDKMCFFWALSPTKLVKTVRDALALGPINENPIMVLLDIPNGGVYYRSDATEILVDSVLSFAESPGDSINL